jgi:hypothetical protein
VFEFSLSFEIFHGNDKHSEAFSFFFILIFMVHFVRFAYRSEIHIVGLVEPIKSAVNEHFMNQEVANSIGENSESNECSEIVSVHHAEHNKHISKRKHHSFQKIQESVGDGLHGNTT